MTLLQLRENLLEIIAPNDFLMIHIQISYDGQIQFKAYTDHWIIASTPCELILAMKGNDISQASDIELEEPNDTITRYEGFGSEQQQSETADSSKKIGYTTFGLGMKPDPETDDLPW